MTSLHILKAIFDLKLHKCDEIYFKFNTREDKTIESSVPFPAPEKGDNWGLSPFHPRIIIVIGECPLLPPV